MSAGHCINKFRRNPGLVNVIAGAHNKTVNEPTQQKIKGKRVIKHPGYGKGDGPLNADIALLELESPLMLNDRVVRACMPQQGVYPKVGTECFVTGTFIVIFSPSLFQSFGPIFPLCRGKELFSQ